MLRPETYKRLIAALVMVILVVAVWGGTMTSIVYSRQQRAPIIIYAHDKGLPSYNVDILFLDHSFRYGPAGIPNQLTASGAWKVVSVAPNGILYELQIHNVMTDCFANLAQKQLGSTSPGANGANFIGVTANATGVNQHECTLQGEITGSGLDRVQGSFTANSTAISNGDVTWKISTTFAITGTKTISKAGLSVSAYPDPVFVAVTAVTPVVSAISGDSLTINWYISWAS